MINDKEVQLAIQKIRPMLQQDGGDIEYVDLNDNVVTVKLHGACIGCAMSQATLKYGVERYLKETVNDEITVESIN